MITANVMHRVFWVRCGVATGTAFGPVVFTPPGANAFKVAGIISGFQAVEEPVLPGGQPTSLVYRYNTGIIVCHLIDHAV